MKPGVGVGTGLSRSGWLAVLLLALLLAGTAVRLRWPSSEPALGCPMEAVTLDEAGVARCVPGGRAPRLPAGVALALGKKLNLNEASEDDLSLLPGVGRQLARRIVDTRKARGRFENWSDVDVVPGVGAAKLEMLQAATEIR